MRTLIFVLVLFFSFHSYASKGKSMAITISSKQVQVIALALEVFNKTGLDINNYDVSITDGKGNIHVTFHIPDLKENMRGSPEGTPSFEVVISSAELTVIRSNLIR